MSLILSVLDKLAYFLSLVVLQLGPIRLDSSFRAETPAGVFI